MHISEKDRSYHHNVYTFFWSPAEISSTLYCEIQLTQEKLKAFAYAVKNHYWYQMYLDDLPVWGKCYATNQGSTIAPVRYADSNTAPKLIELILAWLPYS
jgi:hypothetical protein